MSKIIGTESLSVILYIAWTIYFDLYKNWLFLDKWREYKSKTRLDNKVAIITGCNTGIGKCTALELCKRGAHVILACRNVKKAETAAEDIRRQTAGVKNAGEVVVKELNLSSLKSVRQCAEDILATEKHIHLLVNNAGVAMAPHELTEDGHELHFGTNHLGHFLLTMLLLPRIIQSAPARIVNVASMGHTWGDEDMHYEDITLEHSYSPGGAYGRSKLSNILFTNELARRLEGTGVTTYSLHPGVVRTEISRHADSSMGSVIGRIYQGEFCSFFMKTAWQGAQTTLHCCLNEAAGKENGLYYSDCRPKIPSKKAQSESEAKRLWNYSLDAVGLPKDYNPFLKG